MTSAVAAPCKGCGGAILSPGPRITFTGMPGEYHVSCAASATADWARSDEREACARIASGASGTDDCEHRGGMDMETGEVPCALEARGEICICAERLEVALKIADKIRARI